MRQQRANRWRRPGGHACLLLGGGWQLVLTLAEGAGGGCTVTTRQTRTDIEPLLRSLGLPREAVPEVVARLNLGQEVEFRGRGGVPSVLRHDPRARRVLVRPLAAAARRAGDHPRPPFCPR